jgi:hypothetical protein
MLDFKYQRYLRNLESIFEWNLPPTNFPAFIPHFLGTRLTAQATMREAKLVGMVTLLRMNWSMDTLTMSPESVAQNT